MAYKDIKELLPHREPFLYVDKLVEVSDERIVGTRKYTEDDYFFKGHFPGYPVVPGVILVESMAQCGGAGVAQSGILGDKLFFLATVDKVKFRRQVVPGDEVRFEVENVRIDARGLRQTGKAFVGDQVAAEASWLCLMGDGPGA
jgi:3-hydroxyacyl-[acyl-carrier-protein] dehydratase